VTKQRKQKDGSIDQLFKEKEIQLAMYFAGQLSRYWTTP
jgi:hypothetical protein